MRLFVTGLLLALLVLNLPETFAANIANLAVLHSYSPARESSTSWLSSARAVVQWLGDDSVTLATISFAGLLAGDFAFATEVFSERGRDVTSPGDLLAAYDAAELLGSDALRDALALQFLVLSDAPDRSATEQEAFVQGVERLRPSDLLVAYRQIVSGGLDTQPAKLRDQFVYFSRESILPASQTILPRLFQIVPQLIEQNIWSPEFAERIVRLWVWRYPNAVGLDSLLESLIALSDDNLRWRLLLGELYTRWDKWTLAEEQYESILEFAADEQRAVAFLCSMQERPAETTGVAALPNCASSTDISTEDVLLAASLLQIGPEEIELSRELISMGDMESWMEASPTSDWSWSDMAGPPNWNEALYIVGRDNFWSYQENYSVRIDGLWEKLESGDSGARYGIRHTEFALRPGETWLVAFSYRTEGVGEDRASSQGPSIWLTPDPVPFSGDQFLPSTHGIWKREAMVVHNGTDMDIRILPLFRLWGYGTVWFDQLSIRRISPELLSDSTIRDVGLLKSWQ